MYIDSTLNEFLRTYTGIEKEAPDTQEVINYRKSVKFFAKLDMDRTIRSLNDEEYEKLLDAMKKHEGWREGREEYAEVKKILGVHAKTGVLYATIVHAKSGDYLRPKFHQESFRKMAC